MENLLSAVRGEVKEAVILAAGLGTRLREQYPSTPKFAIPIGKIPLILFPFKVLQKAGVERFTIVVAKDFSHILRGILSHAAKPEVDVTIVENPSPEKGNGYSFLLTEGATTSQYFFVSMCDHLYPPALPARLAEALKASPAELIVGADSIPIYINLAEATKIRANDEDHLLAIGKNLNYFNFVDAGVFIASQKLYQLSPTLQELPVIEFSTIVKAAADAGFKVLVCDVSGIPWTDVDTPTDILDLLGGRRREVLNSILSEVKFDE